MSLTWGGYEGDKTAIITPGARQLDMGYWIVNQKASHYDRGLIKFDLAPLQGKKVKKAWLKLTVRPNQSYLPNQLKAPMPIYPMLKAWDVGDKPKYWVDRRGMGKGRPNCEHQAYPTKWEKKLASGDTDRGKQMSTLEAEDGVNILPGAKADVTELVKAWLGGTLKNHGMIIGKDLPSDIAKIHPGGINLPKDKRAEPIAKYKKLYGAGLVPFFSSDEPADVDFRPRLIVELE